MVKHLHVYMVSIYISYMIPFYMFVNLLTCWHFDSNQPKKKFSLVVIREAVVPCIEHVDRTRCTTVLRTALKLGSAYSG